MNKKQKHAQNLIDFIYESPSPYHVITNAKKVLLDKGFSELELIEKWKILC